MRRHKIIVMGVIAVLMLPAAAQAAEQAVELGRQRIGSFSIDRTEVTVAAFRAYMAARQRRSMAEAEGGGFEYAGGWTRRPGWTWAQPFGAVAGENEPAVHVTWAEADAFCRAKGGRLPTAAEWKQAAYTESRAEPGDGLVLGRTYVYPVGDAPEGMNNSRQRHWPVAQSKRGVNGLYDMGANAWEWLADRRGVGNDGQGGEALTAGGSWWYGAEQTRAEAMQWKPASFYAVYIGFRCAYD